MAQDKDENKKYYWTSEFCRVDIDEFFEDSLEEAKQYVETEMFYLVNERISDLENLCENLEHY